MTLTPPPAADQHKSAVAWDKLARSVGHPVAPVAGAARKSFNAEALSRRGGESNNSPAPSRLTSDFAAGERLAERFHAGIGDARFAEVEHLQLREAIQLLQMPVRDADA